MKDITSPGEHQPIIEGREEVIIITIDKRTGDVESVTERITAVERPVTGAINKGIVNKTTPSITKTINCREERAATEEHQEAVELLTEVVVGTLQAV